MHPDLLEVQVSIYEPSKIVMTQYIQELESLKYGACNFNLNNHRIKFRTAKITPTKMGQFVVLWKRIESGPILPFDLTDPFDFVIVSVRSSQRFGQFIFPKNILYEKGVISKEGMGGKRAIRVYPPWDITDNQQAQKTQNWQLLYFFEIDSNRSVDAISLQTMFL